MMITWHMTCGAFYGDVAAVITGNNVYVAIDMWANQSDVGIDMWVQIDVSWHFKVGPNMWMWGPVGAA